MRSKILGVAALAVGLIVVAGCINYDQELTLNPDGSGSVTVRYDSAAQKPGGEKADMAADVPMLAFTEEAITAEYDGSGATVRDIVVGVLEGSEETPEATYSLDFGSVTDLNGYGIFAIEGDKLKQTFSLEADGENRIFKEVVQFKMEVEDPEQLSSYEFNYTLNCPGEIVETNGTVEGNTITWKYTLDKLINNDIEMTATYVGGEAAGGSKIAVIIGIILCVVILIVVIIVIIVLLSKKKKKPAAAATPPPAEPTQPTGGAA
jgi:hypothetical protein